MNTVVVSGDGQLPDGGVIADAVVDTARKRLLLPATRTTRSTSSTWDVLLRIGPGGSAPSRGGCSSTPGGYAPGRQLGGTNISYVRLADMEGTRRRLSTPNVALFQIPISIDGRRGRSTPAGILRSQRPPAIRRVDSTGTLLYSTCRPRGRQADRSPMDPVPGSNEDRPGCLLFTEAKAVFRPRTATSSPTSTA